MVKEDNYYGCTNQFSYLKPQIELRLVKSGQKEDLSLVLRFNVHINFLPVLSDSFTDTRQQSQNL